MKSIGFAISSRENERRRALVPPDVAQLRHADRLLFEAGYGHVVGYPDDDCRQGGTHIVCHSGGADRMPSEAAAARRRGAAEAGADGSWMDPRCAQPHRRVLSPGGRAQHCRSGGHVRSVPPRVLTQQRDRRGDGHPLEMPTAPMALQSRSSVRPMAGQVERAS